MITTESHKVRTISDFKAGIGSPLSVQRKLTAVLAAGTKRYNEHSCCEKEVVEQGITISSTGRKIHLVQNCHLGRRSHQLHPHRLRQIQGRPSTPRKEPSRLAVSMAPLVLSIYLEAPASIRVDQGTWLLAVMRVEGPLAMSAAAKNISSKKEWKHKTYKIWAFPESWSGGSPYHTTRSGSERKM